jgi:hypothetical protein
MKFNSPITKVLAATVAAGAVTLSAVGFGGTASADGPYVPNFMPRPPVVSPVPFNPYWNVNVRYTQPYLVNGRWVYPYQPYVNQYINPAPYTYQMQYAQAAVTASQFSFITATANVLGMNRGDVMVKLQQGMTLTGIAAERNINRVTFYNAIVNTMRGSINAAVGSAAINPVTGNALQTNLNGRAGVVIDQPGTSSGTNAASIETAYQLF